MSSICTVGALAASGLADPIVVQEGVSNQQLIGEAVGRNEESIELLEHPDGYEGWGGGWSHIGDGMTIWGEYFYEGMYTYYQEGGFDFWDTLLRTADFSMELNLSTDVILSGTGTFQFTLVNEADGGTYISGLVDDLDGEVLGSGLWALTLENAGHGASHDESGEGEDGSGSFSYDYSYYHSDFSLTMNAVPAPGVLGLLACATLISRRRRVPYWHSPSMLGG